MRAFRNVCRHRGMDVAEGTGCHRALSCPYHGWTYGLDGALRTAPEIERMAHFRLADNGLVPVRIQAWDRFVFANVDMFADAKRLKRVIEE